MLALVQAIQSLPEGKSLSEGGRIFQPCEMEERLKGAGLHSCCEAGIDQSAEAEAIVSCGGRVIGEFTPVQPMVWIKAKALFQPMDAGGPVAEMWGSGVDDF